MKQLSKRSVILKRFGITTNEYKLYSKRMQAALDASHLNDAEFVDKHIDEVMKVMGYYDPCNPDWIEMVEWCIYLCETKICTFTEAHHMICNSTYEIECQK